jgi:quercetin dioxygenase-like cupin family protein
MIFTAVVRGGDAVSVGSFLVHFGGYSMRVGGHIRTSLDQLTLYCGAEITMPMPMPGSDDLRQFDLASEIVESERQKPWPSGIHARTLFKRPDLRVVLISMESASCMKEHHVDGSTSVQVLKGHVRYSALGQACDLYAGGLIAVGASIVHEVESLEESVFLLTISWPE